MRTGLGFFCSTSDNRLSTNHKLRLAKLNRENLLNVFSRNLRDFVKLLELSRTMGLTIFRLGSNFIPFASHPSFKREWLDDIEKALREKSLHIRGFGVRVTMHPGQYVVLNSDKPDVVKKSLKELEYHFWVLDTIEFGLESVVVVHVGGVYGNKDKAIRNLCGVLEEHKWLTRRLALENDERYYTVKDVIEIAETFNIPVVYDHFHHKLNPSKFSVDRLISTWHGIPLEIHVSSGNEMSSRFGEHGEYVKAEDFIDALTIFPDGIPIDVIIEAKKKEYAIARLIEELRAKYPWALNMIKPIPIIGESSVKDLLANMDNRILNEKQQKTYNLHN